MAVLSRRIRKRAQAGAGGPFPSADAAAESGARRGPTRKTGEEYCATAGSEPRFSAPDEVV